MCLYIKYHVIISKFFTHLNIQHNIKKLWRCEILHCTGLFFAFQDISICSPHISNTSSCPTNVQLLTLRVVSPSLRNPDLGDPWVAQQFSACLRLGAWLVLESREIESLIGLPAWSLLLPLPMSPRLSAYPS